MSLALLGISGGTQPNSAVGSQVPAQGTASGAQYVAPWDVQLAADGRLFTASSGTLTAPTTFLVYAVGRPDFVIDVPVASGIAVMPMWISAHWETSSGTINEMFAVVSTALSGPGTATAITPLNNRSSRPRTSACNTYHLFTGDVTNALSAELEFWHTGYAFADTTVGPLKEFSWNYKDSPPQLIMPGSSMRIYIAATTNQITGFLKVGWAEIPVAGLQ